MKLISNEETWQIDCDEQGIWPYREGESKENATCISLLRQADQTLHMRIGNTQKVITLLEQANGTFVFLLDGKTIAINAFDARAFSGKGGASGSTEKDLRSNIPGRIMDIMVKEGDEVKKGQSLLILEAMKMENDMQAHRDGRVEKILVQKGDTVESGSTLIVMA